MERSLTVYVWRSSLSRVMVPFKKLHNKYTVIKPFGAIIGSFNETSELQGVKLNAFFHWKTVNLIEIHQQHRKDER